MTIPGIKEIDFQQAYLGKAIPREKLDRYIPKDSVLNLGNVKIKLKASEKLQTVIQKINIHSHSTGIRAKSVRGALALETIRKGNSRYSSIGITLPKKDLGKETALNANQIIAKYLASLPPKVSVETDTWDIEGLLDSNIDAWADNLDNHLAHLNEVTEEESEEFFDAIEG